jgi:Mor family transcriptional regulator
MAAINRGNVSGTTFYMALGRSLRSSGRGAEFSASFDCAAAVAQWTVTD